MIILVSASVNVTDCATEVGRQTGQRVTVCTTLRDCSSRLQSQEFEAVVVDQVLLDSCNGGAEVLWKHAGSAVMVTANFAISGAARVTRELRSALLRREKELATASRVAEANLRNELTGAVTGILLSSELALAQPELPASVVSKLRSVRELAMLMKTRLGPAA